MSVQILVAEEKHLCYVQDINREINKAAKERGTGIARRKDEYIAQKIREGKSVIALDGSRFVGFCYIETWQDKRFVANSGLIVVPEYRNQGVAKQVKEATFRLSRERYPEAYIFGLTTGLAVMKINSELGYKPVPFSELTEDPDFWKGCENCVNFDILKRTDYAKCLCTGMIYKPKWDNRLPEKVRKRHSLWQKIIRKKK